MENFQIDFLRKSIWGSGWAVVLSWSIGLKPLRFSEYNYPPGGWGGWVPGFSGVSLIRWDLSGLSGFGAKGPKGLSGRSAAGENLRDLASERLIFLYKIAFRRRSNPFFFAPAAGYMIHAVKTILLQSPLLRAN